MQNDNTSNETKVTAMIQSILGDVDPTVFFVTSPNHQENLGIDIVRELIVRNEINLIWIDRYREILDKKSLFHAIDASLRLYYSEWGKYNWEQLFDELSDFDNYQSTHTVLYFDDLRSFRDNEPQEFNILISALDSAGKWIFRTNGSYLRSIINHIEPMPIYAWGAYKHSKSESMPK